MNTLVTLSALHRSDGRPLVFVHGGAEERRYRNVLEALGTALALAADYFEFDVRRTADSVLVVHHDEEVGPRKLRDLRYVDAQRAAADLGYELPLLDSILQRARGAIGLDVELKEVGYEEVVLRTLATHGFDARNTVITSFEQSALDAIHALDARIITGLLVYDVTAPEALELFRRSRAAFLGPDHTILDAEALREAHRARIPLVPWTVNEPVAMERLLRFAAVAGLITDHPARAFDARERLRDTDRKT
jgi:glycerophosphoryl diester phosphodiesterase